MITIKTLSRVAVDSLDHLYPHGTGWDNSIWPAFNKKLFALTAHPRLLDLGCAGGGLVKSIIDDGGFAVGVEGSDFSKRNRRAEWATIPKNLFTADITKPFTLNLDGKPITFDIVTAWEVFEHIPQDRLGAVLKNIKRHLTPDGVFATSISTASCGLSPDGIEHHITLHEPEWWYEEVFAPAGFKVDEELRDYFDPDWVRGPVNGCLDSFCTVFRLA